MEQDQSFERKTDIVITGIGKTETDYRIFLNSLLQEGYKDMFDMHETGAWFYNNQTISKNVYNDLAKETLKGVLTNYTNLELKHRVTRNLLYNIDGMYIIGGYVSVNFVNRVKSINECTGVYISITSADTDAEVLTIEHKDRVRLLLSILNDNGYEYAYECRTLSDTHITTDVECEI